MLRAAVDAFVHTAARLDLGDAPSVIDLGCGSGDTLAALARIRPVKGIGLDLSAPAIEDAAKRFPQLTWVIANADRRLFPGRTRLRQLPMLLRQPLRYPPIRRRERSCS